MQRMSTQVLLKVVTSTLMSSKNVALRGAAIRSYEIITPAFALPVGHKQMIHTSTILPVAENMLKRDQSGSFFSRIKDKAYWLLYKKATLSGKGYILYRDTVDSINYSAFFKHYRMPDTFFSWFLVTELHIWMLMVRLMAEGHDGHFLRKNLVEAMWQDIHIRKKKLGNVPESVVASHTQEIGQQFNAAVFGYDEGLLSNDKVLAAAIWRRFLQCECNDPEIVEKLVIYIRKTMIMLDKIPLEDFIGTKVKPKTFKWLDFEKC